MSSATAAEKPNTAGHFAFGENWLSFAATVDERRIEGACESLARLLPAEDIRDRSFFDIGCGSGLSMLAAMRLGAVPVIGIDADPQSATAARQLLDRFAKGASWQVETLSVFDLDLAQHGSHDIVYSWGVLHHTGDMRGALSIASRLVKPGGLLVVALYRKTPFCWLWRLEKRAYARGPRWFQALVRDCFKAAFRLGLRLQGRDPDAYIASYGKNRGMDWHHDVHDWLGGWPYESIAPQPLLEAMKTLGFSLKRVFEFPTARWGLFGTHCDEYVFIREH